MSVPGIPLSGVMLIHAPEGLGVMVSVSGNVVLAVLLGWIVAVGGLVGAEVIVAGSWVEAAGLGGSVLQAATDIEKITNNDRNFRSRIPVLLGFLSDALVGCTTFFCAFTFDDWMMWCRAGFPREKTQGLRLPQSYRLSREAKSSPPLKR